MQLFIAILFIAFYAYFHFRDLRWSEGKFPQSEKFDKESLTKAYMAMVCGFVYLDNRHRSVKLKMLKNFTLRKFKALPKRYDYYIDIFLDKPMHPLSVASWINKHAKQGTKDELVELLVRIIHTDGVVNKRELDALRLIVDIFGTDKGKYAKWMANYQSGQHSNYSESTSSSGQSQRSYRRQSQSAYRAPQVSLIEKYATILGVATTASKQEIKSRYRQLAKMYHPDLFSNESRVLQEDAHQKFIEIQQAYEFLMK